MGRQTIPILCLALLFLGLAASLYKVRFPPGPIADEAAYVMIAQSLWHERDLRYDHRDLQRAYRLWNNGPNGLILFTDDGGKTMHYGKPYVYSLAALPFYVAFGAQGFLLFNMALYLAMAAVGWWYLRREEGQIALLLLGFFFASVTFRYVFWMQPEIFNMACVFFPLAIWHGIRRRGEWGRREYALLLLAGGMIGAAFVSKEPLVLLGAPVAVDLLWQRRWRGMGVFAAGALVAALLLVGVQWNLTGHWSPYRGVQRSAFYDAYPIESKEDLWGQYKGTTFGSWSGVHIETNPRIHLRNAWYFLVGRHTGLLPYFPFALFLLGLYLVGPKDRSRHLLLLAVAGYCLVTFLIRPHNYHGGAGFLGNRYFASVYPALLFLPGQWAAGRSLLLPYAAAGLWTAAVVAVPVMQLAPAPGLQVHARMPTFQLLPLELTLLAHGKIPDFHIRAWGEGVWIVPRQNFFAEERNPKGVWVRGATRSEVIVVSPVRIDALRFTAASLSDQNVLVLDSGEERVVVHFNTEAKRQGTPIALKVKPVAQDLEAFFPQAPHEYYYRFTLSTSDGVVPMRHDPRSTDPRYLGVFLDFTGEGGG